jgi:hypothetical protein
MRDFINSYIGQMKKEDNTEETFHLSGMSRFPVLSKCHIAATESEQSLWRTAKAIRTALLLY